MKSVLAVISPMNAARIRGIARFAREQGWHLVLRDHIGESPLAWDGDGALATFRHDAATIRFLRRMTARGVPVVDLTITRPDIRVPRVICDNLTIGRLAAESFAERNFRNIVWFSTDWSRVHELRFRGLTEKSPAERWVLAEELSPSRVDDARSVAHWIGEKLASVSRPIAALCHSDEDAAYLLVAAARAGFAVPEECAVLSVGNDQFVCENQPVTISAIDQDMERGAYEGAAMLARLMDGKSAPREPVLIPPKGIVLRRSTDAVAAADPLVRQALDYIGRHLSQAFGAAQIAVALHVPRRTLDNRFTAELRRSIGTEIQRQRLSRARQLLRSTDKTIAEIAAETGFSSPSHLSNTFHASTGMTPRTWRKAARSSIV